MLAATILLGPILNVLRTWMQVLHDEYATKYLEHHLGVSPTKATQALVQSLLPLSQGCLQIRLKAGATSACLLPHFAVAGTISPAYPDHSPQHWRFGPCTQTAPALGSSLTCCAAGWWPRQK